MATIALAELSGSTDGRMILVAATATPGTLIHTAGSVTGDDNYDDILLEAVNSDTTDRKLTIEWGGVTSPNDLIEIVIPAEVGVIPIARGILQNGLVIRAFAATANVVMIKGQLWKVRA